jgi:O-antigen/teichoic acid export membrane protein
MKTHIVRNTSFNLIGTIFPLLLTIVIIPLLIKGLGIERFGVLVIAWGLVGYFGLFNFGLGRATTKFMANAWDENNKKAAVGFFWSSFCMNGIFGLIGGVLLAIMTPWLVGNLLNIPSFLKEEALHGFFWLSFSIPIVTAGSSLVGALESQLRFGSINLVQIIAGSMMKLAPLLVLIFTKRLDVVISVIVFVRLASFSTYMYLCLRTIPELRTYDVFQRNLLRPLLGFSGWITVTNIVGPLMTYMDRFVIGSILSMHAVAYYSMPYDVVRKLQVLPLSLSRTLFPIFGAVDQKSSDERHSRLYEKSLKYLILLIIPVVICLLVLAKDLLRLWLGHEFASNSTTVMQVLTIGAFINALAKLPYVLIQGFGRPDITAKFHLLELPFYILMLFGFIHWLGIIGVAIAWTMRALADTLLLRVYAKKLVQKSDSLFYKNTLTATEVSALVVIGMSWFLSMLDSFNWKLCTTVLLIAAFALWSWFGLLKGDERLNLSNFVFNLFKQKLSIKIGD